VVEDIDESHDDQLSAATFDEEIKHKSLADNPDTVNDNNDDVKKNESDVDTVNKIGMYIYI
jgi:hypothetical protein